MDNDTIKAMALLFARQMVLLGTGSLAVHGIVPSGFFSESDAAVYSAGLVSLAILGWQLWQKRRSAVIQAAAQVPGVAAIITNNQELADSVPSEKVQSK